MVGKGACEFGCAMVVTVVVVGVKQVASIVCRQKMYEVRVRSMSASPARRPEFFPVFIRDLGLPIALLVQKLRPILLLLLNTQ